jgi:SAM-dependent methyltransferase
MAGRARPLQPPLVATVLASARIPALMGQGARAALNGLWLGALSDRTVEAVDERYYRDEQAYRTGEWNERGLFDWERDAIERCFDGRACVAVPACGGGREVLALLRAGFDATGYEPHESLVGYAEGFLAAHGHPGRVHRSQRDEFPAGVECDGVVVGWGAYSLIHGRDRRIAFLAGARRALAPGGPLLLSFFERPAHGRELRLTSALANGLRRIRGREPIEPGDTLAPNRVHVFTPAQIAEEVAAAGLELVEHRVVASADDITQYARAVVRAP